MYVNTIFIVDDDPTQVTMLQDHLSKFTAIKIHTFKSGEECLKNLNLNPQVIFLDYNFEDAKSMNGLDVLKKIKESNPETEVVMLTGQDKIQVAVNIMKYGAFDYIAKSESAFHRAEHAIFNIIKSFKLSSERKRYKNLSTALAIGLVAILVIIVALFATGILAVK